MHILGCFLNFIGTRLEKRRPRQTGAMKMRQARWGTNGKVYYAMAHSHCCGVVCGPNRRPKVQWNEYECKYGRNSEKDIHTHTHLYVGVVPKWICWKIQVEWSGWLAGKTYLLCNFNWNWARVLRQNSVNWDSIRTTLLSYRNVTDFTFSSTKNTYIDAFIVLQRF